MPGNEWGQRHRCLWWGPACSHSDSGPASPQSVPTRRCWPPPRTASGHPLDTSLTDRYKVLVRDCNCCVTLLFSGYSNAILILSLLDILLHPNPLCQLVTGVSHADTYTHTHTHAHTHTHTSTRSKTHVDVAVQSSGESTGVLGLESDSSKCTDDLQAVEKHCPGKIV